MRNWMKRIAVRKRGMEALQTVLLLGVAFVVVLGLKSAWDKNGPTVQTKIGEIVSGGDGSDSGSKPNAPSPTNPNPTGQTP